MTDRPTVDDVFDMVQLAGTYIEDGAPATGADRLRKAAAMLDQIAADRDAIIANMAKVAIENT